MRKESILIPVLLVETWKEKETEENGNSHIVKFLSSGPYCFVSLQAHLRTYCETRCSMSLQGFLRIFLKKHRQAKSQGKSYLVGSYTEKMTQD